MPSVITPVFPFPNIINSDAFAERITLSEFKNNWLPVSFSELGYSLKATFVLFMLSLNGTFTLLDVKYIDVPSLLISSSIVVPIFELSSCGFCLFLIKIPGDDVLPSSVKKNSLNLIVLPTLPLIMVSPLLGFKNLIFSFILYCFFL